METTLGCFEFWRAIALIWPILIHNQLPQAWFTPLHIASKLPLPCPPLATIAPTLNVPAATLHPLPTMHRIFTWKQLPQFPCKSHLIYAPSPLLELEVHKRHSLFPPLKTLISVQKLLLLDVRFLPRLFRLLLPPIWFHSRLTAGSGTRADIKGKIWYLGQKI